MDFLLWNLTTMGNSSSMCPSVEPSTWEVFEGLGHGSATALWVIIGLICAVLLLEYIYLYVVFVRHVPRTRRESTMWINSMFFVPTFFSYLGILLPKVNFLNRNFQESSFTEENMRLFAKLRLKGKTCNKAFEQKQKFLENKCFLSYDFLGITQANP